MFGFLEKLMGRPKRRIKAEEVENFNNKRISGWQITNEGFLLLIGSNIISLNVITLKGGNRTYRRLKDCDVESIDHVDYINPVGVFECQLQVGQDNFVEEIRFSQIQIS